MVEILNFKNGSTSLKLKCCSILDVHGILMSHCGQDKNTEYVNLTG
jgi:hypothetical protein